MRWLIILTTSLAALYGGYWFFARGAVEDGISQALQEIETEGQVEISYSDWGTRGFPSRFDTTFADIRIFDPVSGARWEAPWFQAFALSYRPNELIALWPSEQVLTLGEQTYTLFTQSMRASAKVNANRALSFDNATLEVENPRFRSGDGAELAMARLLAAARVSPEIENGYDIFLDAQSIVLPNWLHQLIDPGADFPALIRHVRLDGTATLTAPLDRHVSTTGNVALQAVEIRELGGNWGDLSISAIGAVEADRTGLAQGSVTLSATNWRQSIRMATEAGFIEEGFDVTYTSMAEQLDETPHLPETLTVTVHFSDGKTRLGPLPIGAAPRLQP